MILPILGVKDVDASAAFYAKLGFSVGMTMPGPDGKNTFAMVDFSDDTHIGLSLDQQASNRGSGVVVMVYVPDDQNIDRFYEQVKSRGVEIVDEIKTEYWGDRFFTVHDPDGYVIQPVKTVKQLSMEEIAEAMRSMG